MPIHQQSSNGQPTKPLMPALSSRFRAAKSPVAPKLAGSIHTPPTLSRLSPDRETRPNIATTAREDVSPLSTNITPRSGNRKSRIGADSPATPNGITSAGTRRSRAVSGSKASGEQVAMNGMGLGIGSLGVRPYNAARVLQGNGNSASSPNLSRRISAAKSGIGTEDSTATSPFFHADDAKSSVSSYDAPDRTKVAAKAATFFYLGSGSITASPDPTRSNSSESPRPDAAKFFHANDLPEPSPKAQPQRPMLNKKKSTASIGSPRLVQSPDLQWKSKSPSRPASPLKETSYRSAPPALSSPPKNRSTAMPVLAPRIDSARRTSVGSNVSTPRQTLHKKSSSVNVPIEASYKPPISPTPKQIPLPDLQTSPKPPQRKRLSRDLTSLPPTSPRSTSLNSAILPPSTSTIPSSESLPVTSPLLSPSKPPDANRPPPTPAQEAATNARRERKVLDLEISNSSLLAINRTLEREMRKQSTELRRFQRLSRSGRLSIRTVSGQSKSSLGALAEEDDEEAKDLLNDLDSMDLGDSDDDVSDDSDEDSPTASESASNLSSTHALKQRRRDEKRLMLDLSKHRQLLIDSEKMNSSIRRCLGWSEEMIKEGNRALEYHVRVGDVELGGRVLERDDDSEDERRMGLVSPSRVIGKMEAERLWADARDEAMSPILDGTRHATGSPEVFDES